MGVVFSPEAIRQGRVPKDGAHTEAADEVMRTLSEKDFFNEQYADGFMVYGSVAMSNATVRSDLDVLIKSPSRPEDQRGLPFIGLGAELRRTILDKYAVPLEMHIIPNGAYGPFRHPIDPLLVDHLLEAQENARYSRNFPVEAYRYHGSNDLSNEMIQKLISRFAGRKLSYFTDADFNHTGEPDLKVFQRALELPNALGRKLLRLHREEDTHIKTPAEAIGQFVLREVTGKSLYTEAHKAYLALRNPEEVQSSYAIASSAANEQDSGDGLFVLPLYQEDVLAVSNLIKLNEEYDKVLDFTLRGRNVPYYRDWLRAYYMPALQAAKTTSRLCMEYYSDDYVHVRHSGPKTLSELQRTADEMMTVIDTSDWDY